jgi:predicted ribosome quality control (RQC) complex YloA/Tae2 family protein
MQKRDQGYREFDLGEGWIARVGRTDEDNDRLTFKLSFPQDWWFHVKGCPGSHVVLHHPDFTDPPKEFLEQAARLALVHSKAKNAKKAAVSMAKICDISKSRKVPAGQVMLRKSRTLHIRNDSNTVV